MALTSTADGRHKGEILVIVDLFTRETILTFLSNRTQENVARTLLTKIIFQRGVPISLRTDNAPELASLTRAITSIARYLKYHKFAQEDIILGATPFAK
jgi:hypothetical protein